eukprot:scaffold431_cov315-Prasinococcus_capsulatus_cf.AAC.5
MVMTISRWMLAPARRTALRFVSSRTRAASWVFATLAWRWRTGLPSTAKARKRNAWNVAPMSTADAPARSPCCCCRCRRCTCSWRRSAQPMVARRRAAATSAAGTRPERV